MAGWKYSQDVIDEAIRLREKGMTGRIIAARLGMTVSAVYHHCLRLGADRPDAIPTPARARGPSVVRRGDHMVRRFSEDEDRRILEMERRGMRTCDIARAISRRPHSVQARLMILARREARLEEARANE